MKTLTMTPRERMHLWDTLDRVLAGQPVAEDARQSLEWIRERLAKQCYAEVEGLDLSGDRTAAFKAMKGSTR